MLVSIGLVAIKVGDASDNVTVSVNNLLYATCGEKASPKLILSVNPVTAVKAGTSEADTLSDGFLPIVCIGAASDGVAKSPITSV